jgi:hypothetical protein
MITVTVTIIYQQEYPHGHYYFLDIFKIDGHRYYLKKLAPVFDAQF